MKRLLFIIYFLFTGIVYAESEALYCDSASTNAAKILGSKYSIGEDPTSAKLLWIRKGYSNFYNNLGEFQLINHLPKEKSIVNKGKVLEVLRNYENGKRAKDEGFTPMSQFIKRTFRLYDPAERDRFVEHYNKEIGDNIWILKPTSLSRGRGMKIISNRDDFDKYFGQKSVIDERKYIAQKYISNVLLLNDRKSEIRVYWLIASLDPLRVYFYPEGSVRLCTAPYKLDDFENTSIHIANTFQQKKDPAYDGSKVKWSFADLDRYLLSTGVVNQEEYMKQVLLPKVKASLRQVVRAAAADLRDQPENGMFFGFYGTDFIIDDNLVPWLEDIQIGPGLSYKNEVKKKYLPKMLLEATAIMLEIQDKKSKNQPLDHISAQKDFERLL